MRAAADRAAVEPVVVTKQSRPSHVILAAELLLEFSTRDVFRAAKPIDIEERVRHSLEKATAALASATFEKTSGEKTSGRTILRRIGEALSRGVVSVSDARRDFSAICSRAAFGKERVVIGRHGKNRVAVIPYEDLQLLEELEDRLDLRATLAALKEAEVLIIARTAAATSRGGNRVAPPAADR